MSPIAVYHEHPDWFKPLFEELNKRGIPYIRLNPAAHEYAIEAPAPDYSLFINRMSPSAYLRNGTQGMFYTLYYLKYLESHGIPIVNGYKAFTYETSKALQLQLMESLGFRYPKARVVNHPSKLVEAAEGLRFPVVVKANIGGSGAGITKYHTLEDLRAAADEADNGGAAEANKWGAASGGSGGSGDLSFGVDHTALLQEFIPARGGYITRVETMGGKFLYAIRVFLTGDTFNLCPADICQTSTGVELVRNACALEAPKNGLKVEGYTPPPSVIKAVETIVQQAGIDLGGIEYIVDDRDGELLYYDVNALSNFVADAVNVIGFNPHERLVDYLEERAGMRSGKTAKTLQRANL